MRVGVTQYMLGLGRGVEMTMGRVGQIRVPHPFFGAGKPAWGRSDAGWGGGILQSVLPHPTDKIQMREKGGTTGRRETSVLRDGNRVCI